MKKKDLWNRRILTVAGTAALAVTLIFSAAAVSADEESLSEEVEVAEDLDPEADEETDDDLLLDGTDSDDSWEELELEELGDEDFDVELTPEEEELNEYIDANFGDELLNNHKSLLYKQTNWNAAGEETESSGTIYEEDNLVVSSYKDGFKEIISEDRYDGYDPEIGAPIRYVFDSEDSKEDMMLNYTELFYLWGDETVTNKEEKDGKVTFTTQMTDVDLIGLILSDYDGDIVEGDILSRDSVFDIETKVLEDSLVTLIGKDGTTHKIFECSIEVDPAEGYTEDTELLSKLDAEDTHSLKLVIDAGTEDEVTVESTVGKGCAFYPLLYDGYVYYTDEECTKEATEEEMYDTEKDLTLYASYEDADTDDESELEEGDYELEFDDSDVDLSELYEEAGVDSTESIVG